MTVWLISRRAPGSSDSYELTGEIYDDTNPDLLRIDEYVSLIQTRDGWDYYAQTQAEVLRAEAEAARAEAKPE